MTFQTIQEGKIRLTTYKVQRKTKTASRREAPVFYNPEMEMSRDISVSVLATFAKKNKLKINACDALSATGIRGLRYAKEILYVKSVTLNDNNPSAVKLIKKNIKQNKVSRQCKAMQKDANILLRENVYNFIDIDPFGSPNLFMDSAVRSIWHKGLLAVTATDTAPLSGTYPLTCLKKYGLLSLKTPFYSELGLRILLTYTILTSARYDRAFTPLLSHATSHYFRLYGKIEHAGKIKKLLENFGYVMVCKCGRHQYGKIKTTCKCKSKFSIIGPVYLGKIQDKKFIREVKKDLKERKLSLERKEIKLLNFLEKELDTPFYYNLHVLAKKKLIKLKKTDEIMKSLRKKGYKVSRTHFCLTAIKTNKVF